MAKKSPKAKPVRDVGGGKLAMPFKKGGGRKPIPKSKKGKS